MRAVSVNKISANHSVDNESEGEIFSSRGHRLNQWAKKSVLHWLKNITQGHLVIEDGNDRYEFGDASSTLRASVIVYSPMTYRDIVFNGLVGAGEAYMRGAWKSVDLVGVVRVLSANIDAMQASGGFWSSCNQWLAGLAHRLWRANSKENSRLNIAAHYDLGNDFFTLFLDPSMMYSSAIFPHSQATLEEASTYKLAHICQRLQLKATDHLLEIGTGWGGMAIYAAQHYGCRVTTTTISKEQYHYAVAKIRAAGLDDKITVLLDDYRELTEGVNKEGVSQVGQFDKLVSIEMIEAVGQQYYRQYFDTCSRLLKPDGLLLIQAITVPDQRYELTKKSTDFIQQYIFPGGELPSIEVMTANISQYTNMQIVGIEDITLDYAKTLAAWRERFLQKMDSVKEQNFDDVFIRMWDFYLAYCEGGFRERTISTVQLLAAKPRCQTLPLVGRKIDGVID